MTGTTPAWDTIVAGVALGDDDQPVLELARELARATGGRLALVHAYPCQRLIAIPPPPWERELEEEAFARLETQALGLCSVSEVSVHVRPSPSPVRGLHEAAEELGASVLVAGASRHGALGGVAERLLHAAPCAVAIAPRDYSAEPLGLRRIGVAYEGGPESASALALAADLARRTAGRVDVLTVLEPLVAPILAGREWTPQPELRTLAREGAQALLEQARDAVPRRVMGDAVLLEGRAADRLAAASANLDLLVCGSRGYGPVRSLVVGGVSAALVHAAACPVIVVPRPVDGAVSPAPAGADGRRARRASAA